MQSSQSIPQACIPKVLFQTWKSKTDIPAHFAHWSATLREQNPSYDYLLWDDADNRAFIAGHYPWFLPVYDAYPQEIYRADAVRYFFLYHHGGIYADMDTECLKPLDGVLDIADVVLGRMGTSPSFPHSLPNAVMLSRPRQEFWLLAISLLVDPVPGARPRPDHVTGPVVLKRAYDLYATRERDATATSRIEAIRARLPATLTPVAGPTRVAALPGHVFFPLDWNDRVHECLLCRPLRRDRRVMTRQEALSWFPNSLTVSYWSHSWEPLDDQGLPVSTTAP